MVSDIKICGVRDARGADAVASAGATHAGFVFVKGRRRCVDPLTARSLVSRLGKVEPVGVFLDAPLEEILSVVETARLKTIQLHGQEPLSLAEQLVRSGLRIIRAFSVRIPLRRQAFEPWQPLVQTFLLDAPSPGHGESFPSDLLPDGSSPIREFTGRPTWLAGGLSAEKLVHHPELHRFDGVDVASGVEVDGHQDPERIHAFVTATPRTTKDLC
ncbi:MAG: phosphoribosylanthranilate isomerase [Myxococcota bacterium]